VIEYLHSSCFITRFRAAVSVLVGPCCPALLKLCGCKCAYCCIIWQIKNDDELCPQIGSVSASMRTDIRHRILLIYSVSFPADSAKDRTVLLAIVRASADSQEDIAFLSVIAKLVYKLWDGNGTSPLRQYREPRRHMANSSCRQ